MRPPVRPHEVQRPWATGHLDHATFGRLTPVLSYARACMGAAPGLRRTVRALDATGSSRRDWRAPGSSRG